MRYTPWLLTALPLVLISGLSPARANPSVDLSTNAISISMSDVVLGDAPHSPVTLNRLANQMTLQINAPNAPGQPASFGLEELNLPFLDDLLDEDGNVQLPLGLTLYNTMGDTSIGFGSKF
jgi:hypothetical protein